MNFVIKSDLPLKTRKEIDRIEAIDSNFRTTREANFLLALAPYLTNEILSYDGSGLITEAAGLTVPEGYSGFKKGARFTKKDATGRGVYENVGDETTAEWDLMGGISSADIEDGAVTSEKLADSLDLDGKVLQLDEMTPVNAKASSLLLTVNGLPSEGGTVTLGEVEYVFREVLGSGVAASGTITSDSELVADGARVTIGDVVYTLRTALSTDPVVAYEVLIGANYSEMLANLSAAINAGDGGGTVYSAGTLAHPDVTAGSVDAGAFSVTAKKLGFAGNLIEVESSDAHLSWGESVDNLSGGIDPESANDILIGANAEDTIDNIVLAVTAGEGAGVKYGTGTVANSLVTAAKASASTMIASNLIKGKVGDLTEVDVNATNLSWAGDAKLLAGGVDGTPGSKFQIVVDATNLYLCIADNTIADANWRKLILQSL